MEQKGREDAYKTYNLVKKHYKLPIEQGENYFQDKCIELYEYIAREIKAGLTRAEQSKKSLLVFFGEQHDSIFSSLAQIIAIIAAREFQIETFTREEDQTRRDYFDNQFNQYKATPLSENTGYWKSIITTRILAHHLSLSHVPIDHGSDGKLNLVSYGEKIPPIRETS